jgi:serine/threonine protein kinase
MQQGGELIGQGSYGCVFDPPLECENDKPVKNGLIGKITSLNEANSEYAFSMMIKELPYAEEYFVLIDSACIPKTKAKQKDTTLSKCKTIEKINLADSVQLMMPFGGKSLAIMKNNFNPDELHSIGQKLLEAGTLLLLGGLVHSDLHIANILLDYSGHLRIIDFGNAWAPSNTDKSNVNGIITYFNSHNMQKSLEDSIISAIVGNIDIDLAIAKMSDEKKVLTYLYKLTGRTIESQFKTLRQFMKSSIAFRERNWVSFYKIYWKKVDAWAIGADLLYIFLNTLMIHADSDPRTALWQQCILGLCEIDPGKRLDAMEALELWAPDSKILQIPEVQQMVIKERDIRNALINKIGAF